MAMLSFVKKFNPVFKVQQQYHEIKKQLEIYKRAEQPYSADYMFGQDIIPLYPYPLNSIYEVALFSDILGTIHRALRVEMFKNGYEIVAAEDTDAQTIDVDEDQPKPDDAKRKEVLNFCHSINKQGQELEDVLEDLEDDLNILDLYFCHFKFDYYVQNGELTRELVEVQRIDPRTMRLVMNDRREFGKDKEGHDLYFSLFDRTKTYKDQKVDENGYPLLPAHFKQVKGADTIFFAPWEIVWDKRYRPAELLGFSPVISLWQKVRLLQKQDEYMLELYTGKRPPKGMLVFNTSNRESLKEAWDEMLEKAKQNPHLPAVMGVSNNLGSGGKPAEFLDFMKNMDELQFTESREEFRRNIGALYGVQPVFQADVSTSGGLNNEGLQVTVTNRAIESGQRNYNRRLLKKIVREKKADGWTLQLRPSEEQDDMARLQRQEQSLRNGEIAARLGLVAKYDSKQGEVIIEDGDIQDTGFSMGDEQGFQPSGIGEPPADDSENEFETKPPKPKDLTPETPKVE